MKVTFVLPPVDMTGGIRVASIYADLLQQRGHQVTVVSTPAPRPRLRRQIRSVLTGKGWIPTDKKMSYFDDLDVPHRVIERSRPMVAADVPDADVIIATWWETAEWVAAMPEAKGTKVYFLQHYEIHDYLPVERVKATWALPMHKITIAQWLVDVAKETYGDPEVSLVPNAVDCQQFYAEPRGKQAIPTVGMMFSRAAWKGCDFAYEGVQRARRVIPNLKLLVFSMFQPGDDMLAGCTFFHKPSQAELRAIYASCDAWLFTSKIEGFGLPILEAMACRTPVIGTAAGAAPELLQEGAGQFIPFNDPQALADAIVAIAQMPDADWRAMSERAHERAIHYTWQDAVVTFEASLERAIARQQAGLLQPLTPPPPSTTPDVPDSAL